MKYYNLARCVNRYFFEIRCKIIPTATPSIASRTPSETQSYSKSWSQYQRKKERAPVTMDATFTKCVPRGTTNRLPPTCLGWTQSPVNETHICPLIFRWTFQTLLSFGEVICILMWRSFLLVVRFEDGVLWSKNLMGIERSAWFPIDFFRNMFLLSW